MKILLTSVDVWSTPHSFESFFYGQQRILEKATPDFFASRLPFLKKKIAMFKSK